MRKFSPIANELGFVQDNTVPSHARKKTPADYEQGLFFKKRTYRPVVEQPLQFPTALDVVRHCKVRVEGMICGDYDVLFLNGMDAPKLVTPMMDVDCEKSIRLVLNFFLPL